MPIPKSAVYIQLRFAQGVDRPHGLVTRDDGEFDGDAKAEAKYTLHPSKSYDTANECSDEEEYDDSEDCETEDDIDYF